MQQLDKSKISVLISMVVMTVTLAPLIPAMQRPTLALAPEQNALITIFARSTPAKTEFATTLKRKTVTMEIHALSILAAQLLVANTLLPTVTITTFAPLTLATLLKDANM
jgi:hypothetical protein